MFLVRLISEDASTGLRVTTGLGLKIDFEEVVSSCCVVTASTGLTVITSGWGLFNVIGFGTNGVGVDAVNFGDTGNFLETKLPGRVVVISVSGSVHAS